MMGRPSRDRGVRKPPTRSRRWSRNWPRRSGIGYGRIQVPSISRGGDHQTSGSRVDL